ncbi:MAG: hypothetical protein MZU95_16570 [Desulfomicrobium escambiense]|nr:hypothetical protein [Desulfomicrobium escambiense]
MQRRRPVAGREASGRLPRGRRSDRRGAGGGGGAMRASRRTISTTPFPRMAEVPFDSVRKRMTTLHRTPQSEEDVPASLMPLWERRINRRPSRPTSPSPRAPSTAC